MGMSKPDVAVIGGGIAALSFIWHFKSSSYSLVHLDSSPLELPAGHLDRGRLLVPLSASYRDNITRKMHLAAAGAQELKGEAGAAIMAFKSAGYQELCDFAAEQGVFTAKASRLRFLLRPDEKAEAELAAKLGGYHIAERLGVPVQDEGKSGAFVDWHALLAKLKTKVRRIEQTIIGLESKNGKVEIQLADKTKVHTEVAFIAENHTSLLPNLAPLLVPHKELMISCKRGDWGDIVFNAFHGHYFGSAWGTSLLLGGGGFFAPSHADFSQAMREHLLRKLEEIFPRQPFTFSSAKLFHAHTPIDEFPMIGPVPDEDRMLMACGFGFEDPSLAFLSGRVLAEMVLHGFCPLIPSQFSPLRFRGRKFV